MEEQLQKFAEQEEFDDEEECMMEIQRLVKEDLEKVRMLRGDACSRRSLLTITTNKR